MAHEVKLGSTVITRAALGVLDPQDVLKAIGRHSAGDWGDLSAEDRQVNEDALTKGGSLLSVYRDRHGRRFYVITEWDRSVTTVLLPEDY